MNHLHTLSALAFVAGTAVHAVSAPVSPSADWAPKDQAPFAIVVSNKHIVARYQYRIVFYDLPEGVSASGSGRKRKLVRGTQDVPLASLNPRKTITFQQTIDVVPNNLATIGDSNLLVCTNPASTYSSSSPDEQEAIAERGGSIYGSINWVNPKGEYRDFCGVISQAGDVVFKFLVEQHHPDKLLMPLAIGDNGTRAAVALGGKVVDDAEDGPIELVGKIREVFIWENGKMRSTKKLPKFENTNELAQLFLEHKL